MRVNYNQNLSYNMILANPYDFYHEVHRPSHFINFTKKDDESELPDREDLFN